MCSKYTTHLVLYIYNYRGRGSGRGRGLLSRLSLGYALGFILIKKCEGVYRLWLLVFYPIGYGLHRVDFNGATYP